MKKLIFILLVIFLPLVASDKKEDFYNDFKFVYENIFIHKDQVEKTTQYYKNKAGNFSLIENKNIDSLVYIGAEINNNELYIVEMKIVDSLPIIDTKIFSIDTSKYELRRDSLYFGDKLITDNPNYAKILVDSINYYSNNLSSSSIKKVTTNKKEEIAKLNDESQIVKCRKAKVLKKIKLRVAPTSKSMIGDIVLRVIDKNSKLLIGHSKNNIIESNGYIYVLYISSETKQLDRGWVLNNKNYIKITESRGCNKSQMF